MTASIIPLRYLYARSRLTVTSVKNHMKTDLARTELNGFSKKMPGRIYLMVTGDEAGYHFYYGYDDQTPNPLLQDADPTLLSSLTNEGFTGTYLGIYATSNHCPSDNCADFDWVIYEAE